MGALILPKQLRSPLPLEPLLLFLFAAVALIGLCATAALRKRREREEAGGAVKSGEAILSRWVAFKKAWHRAHGDANEPAGAVTPETVERTTPALPLWQRRILMGERCEMPQFSGLILYDEHGRPLCSNSKVSKNKNLSLINYTIQTPQVT